MENITIPKQEFEEMKKEITSLKKQILLNRAKEFEKNIKEKKYTRKDLGF